MRFLWVPTTLLLAVVCVAAAGGAVGAFADGRLLEGTGALILSLACGWRVFWVLRSKLRYPF